jgi:general secretion pathway protein J
MRRILGSHNGFTLIELLTAIIIAIVLASAVYETLNAAIKSNKKGIDVSQKNQIARVAMQQITNDLLSASVSSTTPSWAFTATTQSVGSTYMDSLVFYVTNQYVDWDLTAVSDEAIIQYSMDTIPGTNDMGLIRVTNRHVTDPDSTDTTMDVLSQDVLSLHFQYYDGTNWTDDWTNTASLPQMVMITMAIRDDNSLAGMDLFTTSVRLPKA